MKMHTNKYIIRLTALCSLLISLVHAQSINSQVLSLDVGKPTKKLMLTSKTNGKKLENKTGSLLSFQLINSNPFKYKYTINATPIDLFQDGTNPFDSVSRIINKPLAVIGSNVQDETTMRNVLQKEVDDIVGKTASLNASDKKTITELYKFISDTKTSEKNAEQLNTLLNNSSTKLKPALQNFMVKYNQTSAIQSTIENIQTSINMDTVLRTTVSSLPVGIKTDLQKDVDKTKNQNEQLRTVWKKAIAFVHAYKIKLKTIEREMLIYKSFVKTEDFFYADSFIKKREYFNMQLNNTVAGYNNLINEIEQGILKDIDSNLALLKTASKELIEQEAKCEQILEQFYTVKLYNYTLPLDVNGKNIDLVQVIVKRMNFETNALVDEYKYSVWMKGGIKIDISAGIFLTSLMNKTYKTEDSNINGKTMKKIIESDKGNYDIGFGSMINLTYRTGSAWVKPGISLGVIFTSAESFQILTGLALVLGKEQRIVLHGGMCMGSVNKLSNPYKVNNMYDLGASNDVPVTKKFSFGHFFGISYNLTKLKTNKTTDGD